MENLTVIQRITKRGGVQLLLVLFTLLSTWQTLYFGFWKDDWISYWSAKIVSPLYYLYWFHPGMTIQFFILTHLFAPNTLIWQIVGMVWRILATLVMYRWASDVTNKRIGLLTALLFSVTELGLDGVGWPTANIVFIDVVMVGLAISSWIRVLKHQPRASLGWAIGYTALAIFVDPFRTLPIVLFIAMLVSQYQQTIFQKLISALKKIWLPLMVFAIIITILEFPMVEQTVFYKFVLQHGLRVSDYRQKFYVVGNYFNSLTNMTIGSFILTPEDLSTGVYNKIGARLGIILVGLLCSWLFWLKKNRNVLFFPLFFAVSWFMIFYLPGFLSEPRLTMGATHRYMPLAAMGIVLCIGILISRIKNNYLQIGIIGIALICAFTVTQLRLQQWLPFRSRFMEQSIWQHVLAEVPNTTNPYIFNFSGPHPIIANTINYSASAPYVAQRLTRNSASFPMVFDTIDQMLPYLCGNGVERELWGRTKAQQKLAVTDVYGWHIATDGSITSTTQKLQQDVAQQMAVKCPRINVPADKP